MIDFTRRRFLFGLAAAPLIVPAVKHFVMPRELDLRSAKPAGTFKLQVSGDGATWRDAGAEISAGDLRRFTFADDAFDDAWVSGQAYYRATFVPA